MASGKEIKSRIKSVKNTGKITKAMELISTVKMKKAQESVFSSRPFAFEAMRILRSLAEDGFFDVSGRAKTGKELVILVSSNKGLCGAYNIGAFKAVHALVQANPGTTFEFVTVGKRGREFVLRTGATLVADFSDQVKDNIAVSEAKTVSRFVQGEYASGKYDAVRMVYGHYVSAITQKSVTKTFLPVDKASLVAFLADVGAPLGESIGSTIHEIEPGKEVIVSQTLPLVLDLMAYEHLLEAKASEHAARMVAMKNAKDSAAKKVSSLTLSYNKARQAAITKEVSEIVSGVESMKE
jgi:F-type H+-transporting ATPase subunit gamma